MIQEEEERESFFSNTFLAFMYTHSLCLSQQSSMSQDIRGEQYMKESLAF